MQNRSVNMPRENRNLTEEQALEILRRDWPEYDKTTDLMIKEGRSLVKWLGTLESFA